MSRLTIDGEVICAIGSDLGLRVDDADAIRSFWQAEGIDTRLDWFDSGNPVVSIGRKGDVEACTIGDRARITIEAVDRSSGRRGIRTVDFLVLRNGS